ncbi:hypothetical protein Tco_0228054 [Tanacetum coccineum]
MASLLVILLVGGEVFALGANEHCYGEALPHLDQSLPLPPLPALCGFILWSMDQNNISTATSFLAFNPFSISFTVLRGSCSPGCALEQSRNDAQGSILSQLKVPNRVVPVPNQ